MKRPVKIGRNALSVQEMARASGPSIRKFAA